MPRYSYGDQARKRVKRLFETLLNYAHDEFEYSNVPLKIDFIWQTQTELVVRTTLRSLEALTANDKYPGKLTIEQIREALRLLQDFMEILEDMREHKRGSEDWHFKLTLWHNKDDKERNLRQFGEEWQRRREKLPGVQRTEARKAKPTPTRYENIPLSGVVKFVGREDELQTLHQMLQENNQVAIAVIAGMGGLGKTELALQYAKAHRETYKGGICWLLAKTRDVGIQVVEFARTQLDLNPPEDLTEDSQDKLLAQVQYCFRHWREGDVLLVLDDVSDYEQVKPYLPSPSSRFKVLMTTRQYFGGIAKLSLDMLQPEAALELLKSLLKETPGRIEKELAIANQLCEWLGYLPLGLELVGRYLARKQDLSLTEMLRRLQKKRLEQPAFDKAEGDMTAQWGVLPAFELSWQELNDDDKQLGCLLSLFAAAPIPWKLVEQCLPEEDAEDLEEIRDDRLLNLHLLQRKGEGIYQLHPLLREFFQYKLTGLEQVEELKRSLCQVMIVVAKDIPQTPTLRDIAQATLAIPHLAEAATVYQAWLSDDDLICPFIGLGRFYEGQGAYTQALPWREQCLSAARKRFGDEHPSVATSLNDLAGLYDSQGRYSEAEPLCIQALSMRKRLLGDEHPDVAISLNNLAELYRLQGRYNDAEPFYIQALSMKKRLLGDEHPDVAQSLNNLALLYYSHGSYSDAEPLFIQALSMNKRLLENEHPLVATSLNNLAELYRLQGRYSDAEPKYIQAFSMRKRLLGDEHPDVAQSLNSLALLYHSQGSYSDAEPKYIQALSMRKRLLGDEHPDVAISLNNLAELYRLQGRYNDAEPLYKEALSMRKRLLGDEHPDVAQSLNNLALLYHSQGSYSDAEPKYIEALSMRKRLLGDEHPDVAISLNNLAAFYYSQGRYSDAEPLFIEALSMRKRLLGNEHPDVAISLSNLAALYRLQERYSDAEPLFIEALSMRKRLLGNEHPDVAISLNNLAKLYHLQGSYSKAEPLFIQALDICERRLGVDHPLTVSLHENLADLRDRLSSNPE
ncbi:tetratricopeptide repeat protein [Nostoc sp.]|uniref:tetratricopeptide repeat protein n=1 Tax=Nostoc sp. TaxID=1180 RepID=UPI002FFBADD2